MSFKIALITVLLAAGFAGLALLLELVITSSNAEKYSAIGTILAATAVIPTLFFLGYQSWQMKRAVHIQAKQSKMQLETFRVEHGPYVFIEDDNHMLTRNDPEGGWF